jgi:hypothetical protein
MEQPPRWSDFFVALLVAVTWGAATFGIAGILSVVLDRDPVQSPAPVYAGLVGLTLAGVAVWLAVGVTVRARTPWVGVLAAAAAVYLVIVGAALLGSFRLFAEQATSPFVIAAVVLAALAVAGTWSAMRRRR